MKGFLALVALLGLANSAIATLDSLTKSPMHLSPSFLATAGDLDACNQALAVAFAELGAFHDEVLDKVGDGIISLLEKNGYDFESGPDDMLALISFIDEQVGAKQHGFFNKVKSFFGKARDKAVKYYHQNKDKIKREFKHALIRFVQHYLAHASKQLLPVMEKINANAVKKVPVQVRLVLAPILYNVWKHLFEHAHVPLPQGFSAEDFVCKGIEDRSCHKLLENIKNDLKARQDRQERGTSDVEDEHEDEDDEDALLGEDELLSGYGGKGGAFNLADALANDAAFKNLGLAAPKPKAPHPTAPQDDLLDALAV